ncbi:conserved hypothetical protein [Xanthomonas citri pv. aurantifolii str. ICPB 10535]|nr:conserved hypothetical protein [Xanthomonas citri pv. aurantifolii str. ICPB 10535]
MACELIQGASGVLRLDLRGQAVGQLRRMRKDHAPAGLGEFSPQFAADEIAEPPETKTQRHQRGDKVHHIEEVQPVLARPQPASDQHAKQATVEAHAAFPDLEQDQRVGQEGLERIEQHVADAPAQHHAKHAVEQQVGKTIHVYPGQATAQDARTAQGPGREKRRQVHQAVPVHLHRAEREGDGVDGVQIDHADRVSRRARPLF